jgi:hypothetical protein
LCFLGNVNTTYWTSGVRYYGNTFIWSATGEIISDYTNWSSIDNQPDQLDVPNECIDVFTGDDKWYDNVCDGKAWGVICEQKQ